MKNQAIANGLSPTSISQVVIHQTLEQVIYLNDKQVFLAEK